MQAPVPDAILHRISLTGPEVKRYLAALDTCVFSVPMSPDTKNSLITLRNELRLSRPLP
jgi:hypothetical protein